MDMTLLLLIIGFLVVTLLIFKFIKKIVTAILTVILLAVLIVGGIFGIVYLDYNYLTSDRDFDFKLLYSDNDEYVFGINMPIKNQTPQIEEISGISSDDLIELDVKKINGNDGIFAAVFTKEAFEKTLTQNEYSFNSIESEAFEDVEGLDITLTKEQILTLLTTNDVGQFAEFLVANNELDGTTAEIAKKSIEGSVQEDLSRMKINLNEILLIYAVYESLDDKDSIIEMIKLFKDKELNVYPERLSFKFVRILPVDTIKDLLVKDETNQTTN